MLICRRSGLRAQRLAGLSGSVMPCAASQRSVGTISMASHGQPSRNAPSGPLLMHFWQPMHSSGSTSIRPNGGGYSFGSQKRHGPKGEDWMQAGERAQPGEEAGGTGGGLGVLRGGGFRWGE